MLRPLFNYHRFQWTFSYHNWQGTSHQCLSPICHQCCSTTVINQSQATINYCRSTTSVIPPQSLVNYRQLLLTNHQDSAKKILYMMILSFFLSSPNGNIMVNSINICVVIKRQIQNSTKPLHSFVLCCTICLLPKCESYESMMV